MALPAGLLTKIRNLEPLPITAQRLTEALVGDELSVDEIADVIEFDSAVVANILRIANSSLYGGFREINGIREAVLRLGTNALLNIVLDQHLKRLRQDAPFYELTENDLWLHGATASLAVNELGGECETAISGSASIAALVHDIGKLIIVRYLDGNVAEVRHLCEQKKITFVEAERILFGCDHAEVGGAVARHWKFPDEIAEAIEFHHRVPITRSSPTLDAVMVANLIVKTLGIGLGAEGMNFELDPACSRRLGLGFAGFCRVCAQVSSRVADLKEAYGLAEPDTGSRRASAA
jgi:HD-like signal output (HDOD) protein